MKKIILCLFIIQQLTSNVFSQCNDSNVETPLGGEIDACSSGGWPASVVAAEDARTRAYAIQVYDAGTNSYNCHGYAWHVSEGGNEVWINNLGNEVGNLHSYWEDGSYIELNG